MTPIGEDPDDLRIGGIGKTQAPAGAEGVSGTTGVDRAEGVAPAEATRSTDPVTEIAQALEAGTLDAIEAKNRLIDQAVAAQIPPGAGPELVAEIRAEVAALLDADPLLESLLRR